MKLQGKTVFITAAAAGIGRSTAIEMAREGADVIATDIDTGGLDKLKKEYQNIRTMFLDGLDAKQIDTIAKKIGTIHVLFNCTGYVHSGTVLDVSNDDIDYSFNLNIKSHIQLTRAFLPAMIKNGGGSIINMASVASSIKGTVNRSLYSATKGAVIGLTKSVAADFIGQGIRCNAICPGSVETPSLESRMRAQGDYATVREQFIARSPMSRMASAEEVALLAVYLASDDSAFVTGTTQIIDGGWSL